MNTNKHESICVNSLDAVTAVFVSICGFNSSNPGTPQPRYSSGLVKQYN
ncbi:MAG: hypothetical protein HZA49_08195 [Planctomycetes bacterium]|nr:hypothetical protein [Planctomycetota bacterium]